jgi:hypothetical protein
LLAFHENGNVEVGVHNIDTKPHCIAAYIKTHEIQSDWLSLAIDKRVLHFADERDKSYPVYVELASGATSWTQWSLDGWAKRRRNGGALVRGTFMTTATYDATGERQAWRGHVSTEFAIARYYREIAQVFATVVCR